eukprot:g4499.t1
MVGCLSKIAQAMCGDEIDERADAKAKIKCLEMKLKEKALEVDNISSDTQDSTMEKMEQLVQKQLDDFNGKLKKMQNQHEDSLAEVKQDCEHKLLEANAEVEKTNAILQDMLRGRSTSDVEQEGMAKTHNKLEQDVLKLMDLNDNQDHDCFELERAYKQDWKSLYTIQPLTEAEWNEDRDKYKKIQDRFYHPPMRKGKTFRHWQGSLYRWAVRMKKTRWTLEEMGHQITENCFDGYPSAAQLADDNGPDLVKIMEEMVLEESPMVDWIESEMRRLLPMLRRKEGITPMMWYAALKDIFNMEPQVLGENCRTDKSRHNYIMTSIRLNQVIDAQIRNNFRPGASNNMMAIRTMLQKLKVNDTNVYDSQGKKLLHTDREANHLEELYNVFGSSLRKNNQNHTAEYSQFLSSVTGVALLAGGVPGSSGANDQGLYCPEVGGNDMLLDGGAEGVSFNSGGKRLTPEELNEMKKTPCPYGKNCFNLINKGGCLRKHTGAELAEGRKKFAEKHPEEAKKKEAEYAKKKAEREKAAKDKTAADKNKS